MELTATKPQRMVTGLSLPGGDFRSAVYFCSRGLGFRLFGLVGIQGKARVCRKFDIVAVG